MPRHALRTLPRPSFRSSSWHSSTGEGHGFTPHDLHVWLYRENPRGTFAQWNPNVSCDAAPAGHAGH